MRHGARAASKKLFQRKPFFAWKMLFSFLFLAVLWHLPLLLTSPSKFSEEQTPIPKIQPRYVILQPPTSLTSIMPQLWIDPTIYTLPSDVGFSARLRQTDAVSKTMTEDSFPPTVKQVYAERTERSLTSMEAITMMETFSEKYSTIDSETFIPSETPIEGSAWRVVGTIAERMPFNSSPLPAILSHESLAPTILRIGVTIQGDVLFVVLERSSGLEKADEAAIRFAKDIRFTPLEAADKDETSWGMVKILWRVDRPIIK